MTQTVKILVTGATGQLGFELARSIPENVDSKLVSRPELDLSKPDTIKAVITSFMPAIVINAAAYTAVDKAETDREAAFAANEQGVAVLAKSCSEIGAKLVHVSTDFVFDGSANTPYQEQSNTAPLGVYGESKLAGEQAITQSGCEFAIVRTAWVYSSHGGNFVKTMLRLMSEKPQLGIVADQKGTPTWAYGLAAACWRIALSHAQGVFHYTDDGECSWFEFAQEIQRLAVQKGLLSQAIPLKAITSNDYPTPAKRPVYSVLDKSKIKQQGVSVLPWQSQLETMLKELG